MRLIFLLLGVLYIPQSTAISQSFPEEQIYRKLVEGPDSIKALDTVLEKPDQYSALILYVAAGVAFKSNQLEDSGFLFYSAQLRKHFDKECFPPKGTGGNSPFLAYAALNQQIGAAINPAVMAEPKIFEKVVARMRAFSPKVPQSYEPGYEYLDRKSEEEVMKVFEPIRTEHISQMAGFSALLNDPEYFAAFQIVQQYNLSSNGDRPTAEQHKQATQVLKRIEKERGLKLFFNDDDRREAAENLYQESKGEWSYENRKIKEAHTQTFEVINGAFAKDRAHVYVTGYVIPDADPQTFQVIKGPYGRDKSKVYCGTVAMDVQDIDAFEVVAWDGSWETRFDSQYFVFDFGSSFETLEISEEVPAITGRAVARDGRAYYSGPARIDGADYATFQPDSVGGGKDKYREYTGPFPTESWPQRRKEILGFDE